MRLVNGSSFLLLLASLLFTRPISIYASPVKRDVNVVTVPLKRLQQRTDLHPTVLLQQHINRGHRRHARMTGRRGPSDETLAENLYKRFNRIGTEPNHAFNRRHHLLLKKNVENDNPPSSNATAGFPEAALGGVVNGSLTPAVIPAAANSLGLDIEAHDVGYIATIQAGTPPRNFRVLMDSGSADFWIGGEGCQSQGGGNCGNHTLLGPKSSSSFVESGKRFEIRYGSGTVEGNLVTDNINIAGLTLNKHLFGVALSETVDFSGNSTTFDGVMGLAKSSVSQQMVPTPVEALASNALISSAITSYKISRLSDDTNDGQITFGCLDYTKFDPDTLVTFPNVNTQGFWEGDISSVAVNGKDLGLNARTAILDTGTTLIIAPAEDAAAVHAQIPGSKSDGDGGFIIPCTTNAVMSLIFGGMTFDIQPIDLLFAPVDVSNLTGDCVSGVSSGQIGDANEWLVGNVFLKNAYFSTDIAKNQISLAKPV